MRYTLISTAFKPANNGVFTGHVICTSDRTYVQSVWSIATCIIAQCLVHKPPIAAANPSAIQHTIIGIVREIYHIRTMLSQQLAYIRSEDEQPGTR